MIVKVRSGEDGVTINIRKDGRGNIWGGRSVLCPHYAVFAEIWLCIY